MISLLSLITPTNLESERDKFFSTASYNPTFHYIWQDQVVEPVFTAKTKRELWDAIQDQDHDSIVRSASKLFEVEISDTIKEKALIVAKEDGQRSSGSAIQVAKLFEEAIKQFELDYKVQIVGDPGFNVRPNHSLKKLIISEHAHFEYISMESLVHHEMVHIIRHKNGKQNNIKRSENYLPTEEGLASWCQDVTNDDLSQAQHAMEYLASAVGVEGSLRDIYDALRDMGMSEDLAWKRASRHKFGFVDTSLPGDILKPAMYFANEIKIAELGSSEKLRLFIGKISLSELDSYPTYKGIWTESKIIDFFKL